MLVPGLIALALRRTLPHVFGLTLLVLLFLAGRGPGNLAASPAASPAVLRNLGRLDVWSVLFLVGLPMLVVLSARLGACGQADWLVTTCASRARLSLSLGLGVVAAVLSVTLLTALAAEAPLGGGAPAWRQAGARDNPVALLGQEDPTLRWLDDPSEQTRGASLRLRLELTVAPGSGPSVEACFSARVTPDGERRSVTARVAGRSGLELELPAEARGPLELELSRAGPGAVLVLPPRALELLVPATSERLASLELALRSLELLAAAALLALGLASWMRPALAAGTVLVLLFVPAWFARGTAFLPGADLPDAWQGLGRGLVPASLAPWSVLGSIAIAALGLLLHARGLTSERRPA